MNGQQRVFIEEVKPQINCGEFPVKRVINDQLVVEADIYCDSHDVLSAEILYKYHTDEQWQNAPMKHEINDRWNAAFHVSKLGNYQYTVQAWVDHFKSWHRDILKKIDAQTDYAVDLLLGAQIIDETMKAYGKMNEANREFLSKSKELYKAEKVPLTEKTENILNNELFKVMVNYPVKKHITSYHKELEVIVEREKANFSSWYEFFPRSLGSDGKHGTFNDAIDFLPYVVNMGFDVIYLPPVHPIGEQKRKGKNNSVVAETGDPGSPWAIGGKEGGHKAIHPDLGTMEDFTNLVRKANEMGVEIALDIAFQCSPDHPYIKGHPEWFKQRPDGTLQYAENPPKKYEDIYPINFETEDWKNLWEELKSIFLFWIEKGVKIFRVDNPHTKSLRFWGWVIQEIKKDHPDIIFLAEAFTRPKVMYNLAKQGFTQSYTYFSWRNSKYEITKYCEELTKTDVRDFFRPNFWTNTPDILPEFLQVTDRVGFIQRVALAATLSSNYGIYGPAYELLENNPVNPGKEEYLNSEKYELKNWDIKSSQSIQKVIARINSIRKENKALQNTHTLKFHHIDNEALICYSKYAEDMSNIILVVVNLDPHYTHSGWVHFPVEEFDMDQNTPYQVHDMMSGSYFLWSGSHNYVEINPGVMPVHIFRIRRKVRSERDFDYFM